MIGGFQFSTALDFNIAILPLILPDSSKICTMVLNWGHSYKHFPMGIAGSPENGIFIVHTYLLV